MRQYTIPDEFYSGEKITWQMALIYSVIDGAKYFVAFILIAVFFHAVLVAVLPTLAKDVCPLLK